MALSITIAALLMQMSKKVGFSGHLVTISKYNCWFTYDMAVTAAVNAGFTPDYAPDEDTVFEKDNGMLMGSVFFRMLGFSQVTEMEYEGSGETGCVLTDLNRSETPASLIGQADAVFDLGTSEHIFHFPNLLAHMGRILKPRGLVLHHAPTNNQVNHGFYQFSPTAYFDYYRANGYGSMMCVLNTFDAPRDLDQGFYGISGDAEWNELPKDHRAAMTLFLARKPNYEAEQVIPMQRLYQ
jgi:hypothetical protein